MTACRFPSNAGFIRGAAWRSAHCLVTAQLPALLALWLMGAASLGWAETAIPPLTARVTDLTATLSDAQRTNLESQLQRFEADQGSQIAVLLVPSTAPETIEQYGIRVAEAWKLGRKGVDDGVLLVVAKGDRQMRIEVGRGLEGAIPDAIAKRIVADVVTPYFRQGDYYQGLSAGIAQIVAAVAGEPLPPAAGADRRADEGNVAPALIMGVLMGASLLARALRLLLGRLLGGLAGGVGAGVLLAALGIPILFSVMIGLFVFLSAFGGMISPGGFPSGGGGWSSGSGSGGFSGGGGRFGGGGASGGW